MDGKPTTQLILRPSLPLPLPNLRRSTHPSLGCPPVEWYCPRPSDTVSVVTPHTRARKTMHTHDLRQLPETPAVPVQRRCNGGDPGAGLNTTRGGSKTSRGAVHIRKKNHLGTFND